jgi:rRNA maturation RNase YbeY
MASIQFFNEDLSFDLKGKNVIRRWLTTSARSEGFSIGSINFIFTSDQYLLTINQKYLQHDTLTDIITFDNSENEGVIEADIFISIPRVRENASKIKVTFNEELNRVLIHGMLHLVGYSDKSARAKKEMTEKEDHYLSLFPK